MAAVALAAISACSFSPALPPSRPDFQRIEETRADLVTLGWLRPGAWPTNGPLLVVIEGDGAAWGSDKRPPADPTPRSGAGARLASRLVNGRPVLYLARPGQYLSAEQAARCSTRYWTDQRFGNAPLTALAALIDRAQTPGQKVILIGFSGGGILAAELALRRNDVLALITIAAPLDLEAWTRLHGVSPLVAASPAGALTAALAQAAFPQRHFYGARDKVVPPVLVTPLARQLPAGTVRLLDGLDHNDDWAPPVLSELSLLARGGGTNEVGTAGGR
jgi:pimeloyl-ACP methyl ester carboxylesterase